MVNWEILVAACSVVFTILGVVVPLFAHLDNKTEARFAQTEARAEAHQKELMELRKEVAQETKDFHGRLIAIEENRRK